MPCVKIAKPAVAVNGKMNVAFHAPPLTVPSALADEAIKAGKPQSGFPPISILGKTLLKYRKKEWQKNATPFLFTLQEHIAP